MYQFINPYNFVPFGPDLEDKIRKEKEDVYRGENQKNLLSGWFDVKLFVKTPLIIPDGAHPRYYDTKRHIYFDKKADVNSHDLHLEYSFLKMFHPETGKTEYAIPGSELRGMIRSTYEAATNSCVPFLLADKPMSQRVPLYGALHKRGLLGYNNSHWILYPTTSILEEVIVVPVYKANKHYYVESIERIQRNKDNLQLGNDGNYKYKIMNSLGTVKEKLKKASFQGNRIRYGASFQEEGNIDNRGKGKIFTVLVDNQAIEKGVKKEIEGYLFVNEKGEMFGETGENSEKKPGTYVEGKGWLQYNVPVDTSRIYHIAYLEIDEERKNDWKQWPDGPARERKGRKGTEATATYSSEPEEKRSEEESPYGRLLSALKRDGAESYKGGQRLNKQPNRYCNFALEDALEKACDDPEQLVPVYYFCVNDGAQKLFYLSGSAAGRIGQRRKWAEILEGHTPCGNRLCPACLLFGTARGTGMKSHVRVSDAYMDESETIKTSKHILQVLAGPRTTAFEFYLERPDPKATYWNYDFYGVTEMAENGEGEGTSYTTYYHLKKARPRGRKMYWHHPVLPDMKYPTNMNSSQESIDDGSFTFRVYFEQITQGQLQDLAWAITLGDNNPESKLMLKLGHAKPLGYGSVKLIIEDGCVRRFEKYEGESGTLRLTLHKLNEFIDVNGIIEPTFDINTESAQSLMRMCRFDAVSENVDYPRLDRNRPIYQWFSQNRTNPARLKTLPMPLDNDQTMQTPGKQAPSEQKQNKRIREKRTVVLSKVSRDRNNYSEMVGYFENGTVFKVPPKVKGGDKIQIEVTSEKNGKIFGNFCGMG